MNPSHQQLFPSEPFVPIELDTYLGVFKRQLARIKVSPPDFLVWEWANTGLQTTTGVESDITEEYLQLAQPRGPYIAVTVVKRQLTTSDVKILVAEQLGIPVENVTYAGQKDRWGITSQRIVIIPTAHCDLEYVRKHCCPKVLHGVGFFLKDPLPTGELLKRGKLRGNRFQIKVTVPGLTAREIENYLEVPMQMLKQQKYYKPNFFGNQRLGQRQMGVLFGWALICHGPAEAIRLFLTLTSPNENAATTEVRNILAQDWEKAVEAANRDGKPLELQWPQWDAMRMTLDRARNLNLAVEKMLVEKLLKLTDFAGAIKAVDKELSSGPSMWIGAYQSYWFNQALAKLMRREIRLNGKSIPLYMRDDAAEKWYRDRGMSEAVPTRIDPFAEEYFLTPSDDEPKPHYNDYQQNRSWRHRNQKPEPYFRGPCRQAFTPVRDLIYSAEDGILNISFLLRKGVYATTLLGMLFDLEHNDKVVADEEWSSPSRRFHRKQKRRCP